MTYWSMTRIIWSKIWGLLKIWIWILLSRIHISRTQSQTVQNILYNATGLFPEILIREIIRNSQED